MANLMRNSVGYPGIPIIGMQDMNFILLLSGMFGASGIMMKVRSENGQKKLI